MVRKKNTLQGQEKVREYYFESGKVDMLKKSKEKLKRFNTADLIYCTAVKPPVESTSRKRPLLLRNQFSKIPLQAFPSHITILETSCK